MSATPKIADVSCVPLRFLPGDRILVRARGILSLAQKKSLHKTISKWAGDHVEVLVIDDSVSLEIQTSIGSA